MDAGVNDGGSSATTAGAASSAGTTATSVAMSATSVETLGLGRPLCGPYPSSARFEAA